MSRKRLAIISSASFLGLGLSLAPVAMAAADTPPPASATPSPAAAAPVVTSAGGTFTVTLPGVGSLSFGVDPTTGGLTALTVAPVDGSGFTAGTPVLTEEGVTIAFTSDAGGTVLQVEIHPSSTGPVVTAETNAADDEGADGGQGDQPGGPANGDDDQHGDDQQAGTPPATVPTTPATDAPDPSTSGHGDSDAEGGGIPVTTPGSGDQGSGQSGSGSGDQGSGQSGSGSGDSQSGRSGGDHGQQSGGGSSDSGHEG